jgi:hypothetical protein
LFFNNIHYSRISTASEGAYNKVIEEINNNFENWKNWLIICNGNHEFEEFIINEYKY